MGFDRPDARAERRARMGAILQYVRRRTTVLSVASEHLHRTLSTTHPRPDAARRTEARPEADDRHDAPRCGIQNWTLREIPQRLPVQPRPLHTAGLGPVRRERRRR